MKNKIKELSYKIFSPQVQSIEIQCYVYFFCLYLIVGRLVPFHPFIPASLNSLIYAALGILGLLLVVQDFLTERALFKTRYWHIAVSFVVAVGLSCLVNINYGWVDNAKTGIWLCIQLFMLYALAKKLPSKTLKNFCHSLVVSLAWIWTSMSLISFLEFLGQIGYRDMTLNGFNARQGFYDNRLFGVFSDPNFASFVSLVLVILGVFSASKNKSKKTRNLWITSIIINLIYIILSGSRTTVLCMLFSVACASFLIFRNKAIANKHYNFIQCTLKPCTVAIIAMVLSFGVFEISHIGLSYLPPLLSGGKAITHNSHGDESSDGSDLLERNDVGGDLSNNRTRIWDAYLSEMSGKELIFGFSPRNAIANIVDHNPSSYLSEREYVPHSDYIAIIAYTGIIGSCIALIGIAAFIYHSFTLLKTHRQFKDSHIAYYCILASSALFSITFMNLLFTNAIEAAIIWIIYGLAMNTEALVTETKSNKKQKAPTQSKEKQQGLSDIHVCLFRRASCTHPR